MHFFFVKFASLDLSIFRKQGQVTVSKGTSCIEYVFDPVLKGENPEVHF